LPLEEDYWLNYADKLRVTARAVIFNQANDEILVEKNPTVLDGFSNFVGGALKFGETLKQCIEREIFEETNVKTTSVSRLFLIENFFTYEAMKMHALEQFFEAQIETDDVVPNNSIATVSWLPLAQLMNVDLRPHAVRNAIAEGTFRELQYIVSKDT